MVSMLGKKRTLDKEEERGGRQESKVPRMEASKNVSWWMY